jgi:hypothetical protein
LDDAIDKGDYPRSASVRDKLLDLRSESNSNTNENNRPEKKDGNQPQQEAKKSKEEKEAEEAMKILYENMSMNGLEVKIMELIDDVETAVDALEEAADDEKSPEEIKELAETVKKKKAELALAEKVIAERRNAMCNESTDEK